MWEEAGVDPTEGAPDQVHLRTQENAPTAPGFNFTTADPPSVPMPLVYPVLCALGYAVGMAVRRSSPS